LARYDCEAFDDIDDSCESIEWLRWAVGRVSGWLGREGGGIVAGEDGGEMLAEDKSGADTFLSCAYDESGALWVAPREGAEAGGEAWEGGLSSWASRASSFSRGERGPS
jgi:hypothetical protein